MLPELPLTNPVQQFTILLLAALTARLIFERIHLPGIIGLLLAGMLLGPGATHIVPRGDVTELLGSVGLAYIMFQAGLEIDLALFRERRNETIAFGLLVFLCSLAPAVAAGLLLDYGWAAALMMGTLLSSHTLVSYPMVAKMGLLKLPSVVTAVAGTLITDTLALLLMVVVLRLGADQGHAAPGYWWVPLLLLAVLVAVSAWVVPMGSRWFLNHREWLRAEKALFALTVLMALASLADLIGTETILGAFLAGVCLNLPLKEHPELLEQLEFVGRMLFIPFFFVETGMRLALQAFTETETWLLAGLLVTLVVGGKSAGSWLTGSIFGYSRDSRILMIGLSIPQAAATLAVTVYARDAGLFGPQMVDAVIILIFVTCLIGPLMTKVAGTHLKNVLNLEETSKVKL